MKYELIIKEIESGEVVCRKECDCIVGAVAGLEGDEIVASEISQMKAQVAVCFGALAAAQDACGDLEKSLYESFKEFVGEDVPKEEFDTFVEKLRQKGRIDEVSISVDEEAIKAMKERASDV